MTTEEKRTVFGAFFYPGIFVLLISAVKLIEYAFEVRFVEYGLFPRETGGLKGIFLMPFIHSDFRHLFNNSVPLLVMGAALFYFYRKVAFRVVFMIVLAGGIWTWISARPSYHIGASGLVYGLFGFLLVSGFIRKSKSLVVISFLMAFVYGSLVWGILPIDYTISWEGHLWGLLAGIALAFYYRKEGPQKEVYHWEEEDEEKDADQETDRDAGQPGERPEITIQYHIKPGSGNIVD